ncbi:hypothetical protein [Candidatus Venteria ishoeyi]|uniref:hypothetical protein n=1 Tax=Candidatus Venteria ishoeyi TaxID=1899563 RepID=UPI0015AF8DCC|nr:hypothetical protein [Candidatus Venteria ishoeyi]
MHHSGSTKIKIAAVDGFGNKYKQVFFIPVVSLEEAKKYNQSFGKTHDMIQSDKKV